MRYLFNYIDEQTGGIEEQVIIAGSMNRAVTIFQELVQNSYETVDDLDEERFDYEG